MNNNDCAEKYFSTVINALNGVDKSAVEAAAKLINEVLSGGNTIYTLGNGGSAATASHFCADLIKGVASATGVRFKAACLSDNIPTVTAIANDISYEEIFVEQLKGLLVKGDAVMAFSGSGNSKNVVKAVEYAAKAGARTIAVCGYDGGLLKRAAAMCVHVNIRDMEVSEDAHLVICHAIKRSIIASILKTKS